MLSEVSPTETEQRPVIVAGDNVREAHDGEAAHGVLMLGPSAMGGYLRFEPMPMSVRRGSSLAPMVVSAFALADELWDTNIGSLEPAPDLRSP